MKAISLSAYSAAAAAMVAAPSIADAQMVHVNIDPDAYRYGDYTYAMDLNADSIIDLDINGYNYYTASSWGGELHGYESQWIYLDALGSLAMVGDRPQRFLIGASINDAWNFNTASALLFQAHSNIGGMAGWADVYTGTDWVDNDGYIGLRFTIDGDTHYGWVRLVIHKTVPGTMPHLIVKELAYNATPDTPAPIQQYFASTASGLVLSDVGESNTSADLQLTFNKAEHESSVSAYRIYLVSGYSAFSTETLLALPPERYKEVLPTGEDQIINFDLTTLDQNGDLLLPETNYRAFVVSIADGVNATENDVSVASDYGMFEPAAAPNASAVVLGCDFIADDISGFIGTCNMNSEQVASLRMYITKTLAPVSTLLSLDEAFFMEIDPSLGSNSIAFTEDKLIYGAGDPKLFGEYNLQVVSMPDSISNTIPSVTSNTGTFFYEEYQVKPEITIIDTTGTGADILLNFPLFPNESELGQYRIYVSKAGTAVTQEMLVGLPGNRFRFRNPSGMGLDMDLSELDYDIDGDIIQEGQMYKVYVGLKHKWSDYMALSVPSDIFILGNPTDSIDVPDTDEILIEGNEIHLVGQRTNAVLSIINLAGQQVFRKEVAGNVNHIPMPELEPGVYIVYIENDPFAHPLRFVVL